MRSSTVFMKIGMLVGTPEINLEKESCFKILWYKYWYLDYKATLVIDYF